MAQLGLAAAKLPIQLSDGPRLDAAWDQQITLWQAIMELTTNVARSPSKMLSSSLHPVVIRAIEPRCSATIAAVVNPMGTIFHAAGRRGPECMLSKVHSVHSMVLHRRCRRARPHLLAAACLLLPR